MKNVLFLLGICYSMASYGLNSNPVSVFENPCYEEFSGVKMVEIPNGSVINFAAEGMIGDTIRTVSSKNDIENTDGLSHTGLVFNDNPDYVLKQIKVLKKTGLVDRKEAKLFKKSITKVYQEMLDDEDFETLVPFSIEANGAASQVLAGILPHVQICPLTTTVKDYGGNVAVRFLKDNVPMEFTRQFLDENLGRSYEFNLGELIKSAYGKNTADATDQVFCSEIAAIFYKNYGLIDNKVITCNVTPEQFSPAAGKYDLLKDVAYDNIWLKKTFTVDKPDGGGFGNIVGWFTDLMYGE